MEKKDVRIIHVGDEKALAAKDLDALVELFPEPGATPIIVPQRALELVAAAIFLGLPTHISGVTGTAKTALVEALGRVEQNLAALARHLGYRVRPPAYFPIYVPSVDAESEWMDRRAIREGTSLDEDSALVRALIQSLEIRDTAWCIVHLIELGRAHGRSQNGLLPFFSAGRIGLRGGRSIDTRAVCLCADSNYQAAADNSYDHDLGERDDALFRRFIVNLSFNSYDLAHEIAVLARLVERDGQPLPLPILRSAGWRPHTRRPDHVQLRDGIVKLGQIVRSEREQGRLRSLAPPSLYSYQGFLRLADALPHFGADALAMATVVGNASFQDQKLLPALLRRAFGGEVKVEATSGVKAI